MRDRSPSPPRAASWTGHGPHASEQEWPRTRRPPGRPARRPRARPPSARPPRPDKSCSRSPDESVLAGLASTSEIHDVIRTFVLTSSPRATACVADHRPYLLLNPELSDGL